MLKLLTTLALLCPHARADAWFADWTVRPAAPERYSLLSGYALTLTALGFRHSLGDDLQEYAARERPLGDASVVGDYAGQLVPNVVYVAGTWLAGRMGHARGATRAQLMTMATAESALITTVIKVIAPQGRPNKSSRNSFPSGHATTIFAFAAVVGAEHGWPYAVPAYLLAAFTGLSRINDNMHFLHDVVAGATVGLSIGLGVVYAHRLREGPIVHLLPLPLEDGGGLQAVANF